MSYLPSNLPYSSPTPYTGDLSQAPLGTSGSNTSPDLSSGILDPRLHKTTSLASNPDASDLFADLFSNDSLAVTNRQGYIDRAIQAIQRLADKIMQELSAGAGETGQTGQSGSAGSFDVLSLLDDPNEDPEDGLVFPTLFHSASAPAPAPAPAPPASSPPPDAASNLATPGASTSNVQLDTNATQPPNSINVMSMGAKGDGIADDQAAIQHAFDVAKGTGQTVWFPPGTYNHSGVLTADGIHVAGSGEQSVLRATNPDQSAIRLTGNNGSLSGLTTAVMAPNRSSMPNAAAILVQNASNATVTDCVARGAASNGIRLDNASNCTIRDNLAMGTNADGIALMNGSCNNLIEHNVVYQAGDDAYSDDSYAGDARQDEGNVFRDDLAYGNHYGRGFALMGSRNDTIEDCVSYDTPGHGIAAGTDGNSGTMTGYGHVIRNNLVLNARDSAFDIGGMNASGNTTSGVVPVLSRWTRKTIMDRNAINSVYVPGTGPGSNNTPGNRT